MNTNKDRKSIVSVRAFTVAYYNYYGYFPDRELYAPTEGIHTVEAFEALAAAERVEVIDTLNDGQAWEESWKS